MKEADKQQVEDERGELIKAKTKLELDIRDLEEGVAEDVSSRVRIANFFTFKWIYFWGIGNSSIILNLRLWMQYSQMCLNTNKRHI